MKQGLKIFSKVSCKEWYFCQINLANQNCILKISLNIWRPISDDHNIHSIYVAFYINTCKNNVDNDKQGNIVNNQKFVLKLKISETK